MADLQRKTDNLCNGVNENYWIASGSNTAGRLSGNSGLAIPVEANTYYTVSTLETQTRYRVGIVDELPEYDQTVTALVKVQGDSTSNDLSIYSHTGKYLILNATDLTKCMINTGSTALPYEPYGWQHSLLKLTTATEAVENPLYLDGTAITSYTISGNTMQNGTPTPDNPVDVNGVGNATSNVMPYATAQTISDNGITVTSDGQGTYHVEGLATADANITLTIPEFTIPVCVGSGGNGTMALFNGRIGSAQGGSRLEFYNGSTRIDSWQLIQANRTSTAYGAVMDGKNCNKINIFIKSGISANADVKPMFTNDGTLPTTYEPYGYKIPISSPVVTTNIYLGSTQTVRQVKKIVFDGTENWSNQNVGQHGAVSIRKDELPLAPDMPAGTLNILSTHFKAISNSSQLDIGEMVAGGSYLNFDYDGTNNLTDFKAFLATQYANGTPVIVYYVLATPETAAVNEPLMKIGTYIDTLSNATAIPTTDGANSITVDTTVQPSEFTATWTGWHNATVKEWDGSQWNE